jgi:hypothetical protein
VPTKDLVARDDLHACARAYEDAMDAAREHIESNRHEMIAALEGVVHDVDEEALRVLSAVLGCVVYCTFFHPPRARGFNV